MHLVKFLSFYIVGTIALYNAIVERVRLTFPTLCVEVLISDETKWTIICGKAEIDPTIHLPICRPQMVLHMLSK